MINTLSTRSELVLLFDYFVRCKQLCHHFHLVEKKKTRFLSVVTDDQLT